MHRRGALNRTCDLHHALAAPTVSAMTAPRVPSGWRPPAPRWSIATSTSSTPHRAERSIGRIVIGEIAEVPGKQRGTGKPCQRSEDTTDADPAPLGKSAAWSIAVKQGETENDNTNISGQRR